jgi:hypothetical protein
MNSQGKLNFIFTIKRELSTLRPLALLSAFGALLVIAASACTQESPKLVPFEIKTLEKVNNGQQQVQFSPQVDILFVVDDSGSMAKHQQELARNIQLFIAGISKTKILDYHIGVITTSADGIRKGLKGDGQLVGSPAFVDRNTPGGADILARNLIVGVDGSTIEKVFDPVTLALSAPLINLNPHSQFYRPSANIAIFFVTDAEDQSEGSDPEMFYQFLLRLKGGDRKKVLSYGAIVPTGDSSGCPRDDGTTAPLRLERFLKLAGGQEFGLCDTDFGTKLANAALNLTSKVGRILYLQRPPAVLPVNTIRVIFGTQVLKEDPDTGWFFDAARNALIFGPHVVWSDQPTSTQVQVSFDAAEYEGQPK